ncbi:type VII secretion protein EccB [Kitasatospora xanthocidica]|uniref:type VII secretion protein EccB n=1 Tax=Kitasatospora xanthocidica TaxID=83382 RepID=UPI00167690AC|nr:type VII secretion protein EccB [Kitasatospora xanthocidica]GHF63717.1 type VII secretion protein EccB [Kitasatospora xanthocidica]
MQSRRDQVQAHLFVMSRLASGMLRAEPDAPDTPTGRTTRGTMTGLAVAVLIGLGVTVYGVIKPGGNDGWAKPGTLVVVEETGARYLSIGGQLHPVLNDTSARLLAGDQMTVRQVSRDSIADVPRGGPVGIVGAPDGLPPASELGGGTWLVCGTVQPGPTGAPAPRLGLLMDPAAEGRALTAAQGVLVSPPDGSVHLLWQGQRLRVDTANQALQALGYGGATPFPVPAGVLNALPAGPDLASPAVARRGEGGPVLGGKPTRIGQLFTAVGGAHYLLTKDGLAPLSPTLYALLLGDPRTQKEAYGSDAPTPASIGAMDLAAHTAPGGPPAPGLPETPPALVLPLRGEGVCADLHTGAGAPTTAVTMLPAAQAEAGRPPTAPVGAPPGTCAVADRIAVRPGRGALVRALSGAGAGSTEYLVTEAGVRYPLPAAAVAKQLGYGGTTPVAVPAPVLGLLPAGPSLDPAALAAAASVAPTAGTVPALSAGAAALPAGAVPALPAGTAAQPAVGSSSCD